MGGVLDVGGSEAVEARVGLTGVLVSSLPRPLFFGQCQVRR